MKIKNVYLVDDDSFFAKMFAKRLKAMGNFDIHHFDNVEEALIYAEVDRPEILFLDNILCGLSGVDSIPKWKKLLPKSRIAIVSNNKSAEVLTKAVKYGSETFLLKDEDLVDGVSEFLQTTEHSKSEFSGFLHKIFTF